MQSTPVAPILNRNAHDERANDLLAAGLNGLRMGLVELAGDQARLEVFFINALHVQTILDGIAADPASLGRTFEIHGGLRLRAGPGSDQVHCVGIAEGQSNADGDLESLILSIAPIGDYSTYRVELVYSPTRIDPYFSELPFKFRPGCFGGDCQPERQAGRPRSPAPAIDYLAKDYDSFRHALIAAMMQRVPGWQVSSEADLDQVLIDLFAAAADELSDFQDRVMNEAWLGSARKRVSLARHARLVDYHIHQGNQSCTWLALLLAPATPAFTLDAELVAWAGGDAADTPSIHFASRQSWLVPTQRSRFEPLLNSLHLHTWSDARPALAAGSTQADLVSNLPGAGQAAATQLRDRVQNGSLKTLLIEEKLDPLTGLSAGRDPRKRQLLHLVSGDENSAGKRAAQALRDPLTGTWYTRVHWQEADALRHDYAFVTWCPGNLRVAGISAFHGNLLEVHQGRPIAVHFRAPGSLLPSDSDSVKHRHYQPWTLYGETRGVLCELPEAPLAYLPTPTGGEVPPRSTLRVRVEPPSGVVETWDEVISLVHSDASAEAGDHYVVETDELGRSSVRFGNGINGRLLPEGAIVHCQYQTGGGVSGNVGAGSVIHFQSLAAPLNHAIEALWNPFDVIDGRDPEAVEKIIRHAPEAFRVRQLRAVTLADYIRRAEEVPGVARAVARYTWAGSWRTVRLVIDPRGVDVLTPELAAAVAAHLEAVRLIGEDLEIRPPRFVPLEIEIDLCLHADVWPEDVRWVVQQELSPGWTPDGRMGFFHPDAWSFGQALHRSQLAGRLAAVSGVEHVAEIRMRRFNLPPPPVAAPEVLETAFDEIFLVKNDPDHRERGFITINLDGGRK